jgi:hypothetical protein
MLYYTSTKNPIARAGIIRQLMDKGYGLFGNLTVSDYFTRWPACVWPVVQVDDKYGYIDLRQGIPEVELPDLVLVSSKKIYSIPNFKLRIPVTSRKEKLEIIPVFPPSAKYGFSYRTVDGRNGYYTISNPISSNQDSITTYAFGHGIRTFKKSKIRGFCRV